MTIDATFARDEGRHDAGPAASWEEVWSFDFAAIDDEGDIRGGFVRFALRPHDKVAWYWAAFVTPEHPLVLVRDDEVPPPRAGRDPALPDLEVRADGLWAELVCETPMEHWGLGLEAFGIELDDPFAALHSADELRGDRVAVGLDLEWEVVAPAYRHAATARRVRYEQLGTVYGELLVGRERIPFAGCGSRAHTWGDAEWTALSQRFWCATAGELVDRGMSITTWDGNEVSGYRWELGEPPHAVAAVRTEAHRDGAGIPDTARYIVGDELEVELEVRGLVPLVVPRGADQNGRLVRALAAFTAPDWTGAGWADWCDWLD